MARPCRARWSAGFALLATLAHAAGLGACGAEELDPPLPGVLDPLPDDVRRALEERAARVRRQPKDADAWLAFAMTCDAHELAHLAAPAYARAAELDPRSARAWYHLARARGVLGDPEGALTAAGQAAELEPGYAPVHWRTGDWLLQLGRLDEAEAAFRRASSAAPGDAAGRWGSARVALLRGDPARALELLDRAPRYAPQAPYTHHLRAMALRERGQLGRAAEEAARGGRPAWIDPWKADALEHRAGFHGRLEAARSAAGAGDHAAAARALESLHAEDPSDVNVAGMLADVYTAAGEAERARELLLALRERRPAHYRVALNLARVHGALGRHSEALVWIEECIALHPGFAPAHAERDRILRRLGRSAARAADSSAEGER